MKSNINIRSVVSNIDIMIMALGKPLRVIWGAFTILLLIALCGHPAFAQPLTPPNEYTIIHNFEYSSPAEPPDGRYPSGGVAINYNLIGAGQMYGTTSAGGYQTGNGYTIGSDYGTLYTINIDGSGYQILHSLDRKSVV